MFIIRSVAEAKGVKGRGNLWDAGPSDQITRRPGGDEMIGTYHVGPIRFCVYGIPLEIKVT
jgi:hypothetical protein